MVEGKDDFIHFVQDTLANSLYEAVVNSYQALDDERVVVEGRIRWIDDDRVIRDDPVTWAMEFRDGLLVRFIPARTLVEAETILGAPRRRRRLGAVTPSSGGTASGVSCRQAVSVPWKAGTLRTHCEPLEVRPCAQREHS